MKYSVPEIGEYVVDETLGCFVDGNKFDTANNIDDAKNKIRASVANKITTRVSELQHSLGIINSINVGLIDEKYRVKAFK